MEEQSVQVALFMLKILQATQGTLDSYTHTQALAQEMEQKTLQRRKVSPHVYATLFSMKITDPEPLCSKRMLVFIKNCHGGGMRWPNG